MPEKIRIRPGFGRAVAHQHFPGDRLPHVVVGGGPQLGLGHQGVVHCLVEGGHPTEAVHLTGNLRMVDVHISG